MELRAAQISQGDVERTLQRPILIAYDTTVPKRISYVPATGLFEIQGPGGKTQCVDVGTALNAYNQGATP